MIQSAVRITIFFAVETWVLEGFELFRHAGEARMLRYWKVEEKMNYFEDLS